MYVRPNFKTKHALTVAVMSGMKIKVFDPGIGLASVTDGTVFLEGPHAPAPHTWYAEAEVKDGIITKIK